MTTERALRYEVIATALAMNAMGINRGKSGNVSVRWRESGFDGFLVTPTGVRYDRDDAGTGRRDDAGRRCARNDAAFIGVALPSRHLCGARRCAGRRPYARAVRHDARLHASRNPAVSLHGRGGRRQGHSMRTLCDVRHAGTLGPCRRCAGRAPRVPAGEPRDDRHRRVAGAGAGVRRGSRVAGGNVLARAADRRTGAPARGGDGRGAAEVRHLRTAANRHRKP